MHNKAYKKAQFENWQFLRDFTQKKIDKRRAAGKSIKDLQPRLKELNLLLGQYEGRQFLKAKKRDRKGQSVFVTIHVHIVVVDFPQNRV